MNPRRGAAGTQTARMQQLTAGELRVVEERGCAYHMGLLTEHPIRAAVGPWSVLRSQTVEVRRRARREPLQGLSDVERIIPLLHHLAVLQPESSGLTTVAFLYG